MLGEPIFTDLINQLHLITVSDFFTLCMFYILVQL